LGGSKSFSCRDLGLETNDQCSKAISVRHLVVGVRPVARLYHRGIFHFTLTPYNLTVS
jgi:hypothetical protein